MEKSRFEVVKASKFEQLTNEELQSVKGGDFCILCMKVDRKWPRIGGGVDTNDTVPNKGKLTDHNVIDSGREVNSGLTIF